MKKIPPGAEASNVLVGEVDFLTRPIIAFVRLAQSVCLGDLTEVPIPTRFLFIMLGPASEDDQSKYHEIGRCIATLMADEIFHDVAYKAKNTDDLLAGIDEFLDQVTVLPPGVWDPNIRIEPPKLAPTQTQQREQRLSRVGSTPVIVDETDGGGDEDNGGGKGGHGEKEDEHAGLVRTGRIFGGLVEDIKRRLPHYLTDFTHALHIQCVASFIFMYFACITPVITFGGLLGEATHDYMATLESLLGAAICGIGFALFSGQPLTILGSTGPILVYEKILVSFCDSSGLDYLSFRFWIGLWTAALCIVLVATDMSAMVKYFTRFTEESFSSLISFIFIYEAIHKLYQVYEKYPIKSHPTSNYSWYYECECGPGENDTGVIDWDVIKLEKCEKQGGVPVGEDCHEALHHPPMPDIFLMSAVLMFGTFAIAYSLKEFRTSRYFPTRVRQTVSDFAVLVAVLAMVGLDALFGIPTPKLSVPTTFHPSNPLRKSWFIHPFGGNPWWTALAAILPALLATILIFMDQQITAVIVNRKENKLKKGVGYHLDLLVVALLLGLCSILGLPWFVAATVLSINHVSSLKVEKAGAPGEKPKVVGCREQRVTGFVVFLLVGLAVLMTKILVIVPMPVLYGVFLFMGISSLKGVQFVDRLNLLFIPGKHQPDYHYLRVVELKKVHLFTIIQLSCLAILWIIKSTKAALVFPIMVLAMVGVRKAMDYIFTQPELAELDDILPEVVKREKHDKKQKVEEARVRAETLTTMPGRVQVPLSDGNLLSIPVSNVEFLPDLANINISEDMAKTGIWKTMAANTGSYADIIDKDGKNKTDNSRMYKKKNEGKKRREATQEQGKYTRINDIPEEQKKLLKETDKEFHQTSV
ncbi:electroneutral sodium bicarbonate exchanger 1-like [Amphiura filiformis]|uniref:electroneutral sodium bicarbonate exchanger 1-like n=1 Tax=Amphiura filiformis TaxID=82378 RepID=UPI003B21774D